MPSQETDAAWAALQALGRRPDAAAIRPLFAAEPDRFARSTHRAGDVLLDLSRTAMSTEVLAALLDLARATDVTGFRDAMARGEPVNATERRAALHMALRAPPGVPFRAGEEDAAAAVHGTLALMRAFTDAVHAGEIRGATGQPFTDVLNIGIGGSDLGPAMAARALWTPAAPLRAHYLANVDAHAWEEVRARLDPARTLVLVASKTFTTQETMTNAALARAWLAQALGAEKAGLHLAALSTNLDATSAFGIAPSRVFGFRDWVGGRFSMWSAIGLSLALALGWDAFLRLLAGARMMDEHFLAAPLHTNLPVLMALAEVWHVNGLGYPARAVLPYDERLSRFPAHLQQLEMESLGKRVTVQGTPVARATGPVVFGEPGTNAQHSFLQLIHQGTTPVPVDFVLVANPSHDHADSHRKLLANGLAQAEALLRGKDEASVAAEMRTTGATEAEIARLAPHRAFPGDRPSTILLVPHLDAQVLGQLVALYEHKVACLGALWNINPFDQWGVELGKQLAGGTLAALEGRAEAGDPATAGMVAEIARLQAGGMIPPGRVLAVARDGAHRFSKAVVPEILLRAGLGVEGDAHAGITVKHRSRVARDPTQPNLRQIHLIHAELFDELAQRGFAIAPGEMGENVTTEGLDLLALPRGALLRLGADALVEVTGLRNPCAQLDAFRPGLMQAVLGRDATGALLRKAGIMAVVRAGGPVRPGDAMQVALPAGPHHALAPV